MSSTVEEADRKKYAVVGGGGYVGWRIVKRLVAEKQTVVIFDMQLLPEIQEFLTNQANAETSSELKVSFFRVDIRDTQEVMKGFSHHRPQIVFHVASYGMSGREMLNKRLIEGVNIDGVKNTLRACAATGVERLVYTSSYNTVYGGQMVINGDEEIHFLPIYKHPDHYALTKSISEQLVLMADRKLSANGKVVLRTCSLRLPGIYGPGELRHLPRIVDYLEKGWVCFQYGEGLVDFVHVDNVVQAHLLAADALCGEKDSVAGGKSYFISDGAPINNFEFFRPLIEELGYAFPTRRLPFNFIFFVATMLEFFYSLDFVTRYNLDRYFPLLTRTEVYKTGVTHYFSIEKAKRELGYRPRDPPNDLSEVIRLLKPKHQRKVTASSSSSSSHVLVLFRKIAIMFLVVLIFFGICGKVIA